MGFESMPVDPGKEKVFTPSQLKIEKEYLDDLFRGLDTQSVAKINAALNIINEDPLETVIDRMRSEGEGGEDVELVSQIKEFQEMGASPKDIAQGIKYAHEAFVSRMSDKQREASDKYKKAA